MSDPGGLEADHGGREARLSQLSFEQLVDTLDELARRISSGEVGIEEAARLYELAGAVHAEASLRLERVRARVEGLIGPADTGSVETGSLETGPGASDEGAETAGPA